MMNHILSNLSEEYQTILEMIEHKLDYEDNPLNIERNGDILSVESDPMNKQSIPRTSR